MPTITDPVTLTGRLVRLEPLDHHHVPALAAAAAQDRGSYRFTVVPHGPDAMTAQVNWLSEGRVEGTWVPFAQVRQGDGEPVGITCFLNPRRRPGDDRPYAIEIGGTWLAAPAQRTGVNIEAKLLLLAHAFETWQVVRVDLKTDARNARSREAITRLGARFEGVLRNWQPSTASGEHGLLRDTAMYSVVADEWPAVRRSLVGRLARYPVTEGPEQ